MKQSWAEMLNPTTAGHHLIQSIADRWIVSVATAESQRGTTPAQYSMHLLRKYGVGLLNATYYYESDTSTHRGGTPKTPAQVPPPNAIDARIDEDWEQVNQAIVADMVKNCDPIFLLCGDKAKRLKPHIQLLGGRSLWISHPSTIVAANHNTAIKWERLWLPGQLKTRLGRVRSYLTARQGR